MSAIAMTLIAANLAQLGSPPAGDEGKCVVRIAADAVQELKVGTSAGTSWVLHDLHSLARESGTTVRDDPLFGLAKRLLLALPGYLPAPALALDDDGEIALDWRQDDRLLSVTLRGDGRLTYACRLAPLRRKHGTEVFADAIPKEVLECIQQVVGS